MRLNNIKFCVIIPMYNEAGNVSTAIHKVNKVIKENAFDADIIVVDDGSIDATAQEIMEQKNIHNNLVIATHEQNKGFGSAVRTGMQKAIQGRYDFAVFMDADLTMDPKYLISFYKKIAEGYDFVIGSRFIEGGGMEGVPFKRAIVSWVGGTILRLSFRLGLKDYTQGFRAIRCSIIEKMNLTEPGFPVLIQELYQAIRYTRKFTEIPFILTSRTVGVSKFNYTPKVFLKYLYYAAKASLVFKRAY